MGEYNWSDFPEPPAPSDSEFEGPVWVRFTELKDSAIGWIESVDVAKGAQDFDGNECGLMVLKAAEGEKIRVKGGQVETTKGQTLKVSLDKPSLIGAVERHMHELKPGKFVRLIYLDDKPSQKHRGRTYKLFTLQQDSKYDRLADATDDEPIL